MKLDLEQIIIGAVVFEGKYGMVGHILKEQNFTTTASIDLKIVWRAIGELFYSLQPYDLISLTQYLKQKYNKSYAGFLTSFIGRVTSSANLGHHAMILLDMDIRQKFTAILNKHVVAFSDKYPEARASVVSVLEELNAPGSDVLLILEACVGYFQNLFYPQEYFKEIDELQTSIPLKVKQIKKLSQVKFLFSEIMKIHDLGLTHKSSIALHQLSDLVDKVCNRGTTRMDEVIQKLTETQELF